MVKLWIACASHPMSFIQNVFVPTRLQNALLPNIHHHSKAVYEYYFYGPLLPFASRLIGPNLKGSTSQLTFKTKGNTQNFEWHQDNTYGHLTPYNSLSCLTALDKVTTDNGCIRCDHRSDCLTAIQFTFVHQRTHQARPQVAPPRPARLPPQLRRAQKDKRVGMYCVCMCIVGIFVAKDLFIINTD
jgi:hypothetical protein